MKYTAAADFATVVRWLLGVLLIWAAISKLANLQEFYGSLIAYRLPLALVLLRATAVVLPWVELLCGLMLLARFRFDAALLVALAMFAAFVIATGQAWARGLDISCGCLDLSIIGIRDDSNAAKLMKSTGFAFVRAVLLVGGAVYLWKMSTSPALSVETVAKKRKR